MEVFELTPGKVLAVAHSLEGFFPQDFLKILSLKFPK
jgi:hypothetical protein